MRNVPDVVEFIIVRRLFQPNLNRMTILAPLTEFLLLLREPAEAYISCQHSIVLSDSSFILLAEVRLP